MVGWNHFIHKYSTTNRKSKSLPACYFENDGEKTKGTKELTDIFKRLRDKQQISDLTSSCAIAVNSTLGELMESKAAKRFPTEVQNSSVQK